MYASCSGLVMIQSEYPTVADALRQMKTLGFGAFDLDIFENWQHLNPSVLARTGEQEIQSILESIAATGMKVSSFNCGLSRSLLDSDPAAFAQNEREFRVLLDLAEALQCPNITLGPGGNRDSRSHAEVLSTLRQHLESLGRLAEGHEVSISIENHANTIVEEPDVALEFIRYLWPAVGITYDPSHVVLQDIPLADSECLMEYTYHAHVRNASSGKMQDTMTAGTVDFEWVIRALEDHGYDGGVTIEYFGGFDTGFQSTLALRDRLVQLGVQPKPPHVGAVGAN